VFRDSLAMRSLVIGVCAVVAYAIRHHDLLMPASYWLAVLLALWLNLVCEQCLPLRRRASPTILGGAILGRLLLVALVMTALAYGAKLSDSYSRLWSAYWLAASWLGLLVLALSESTRGGGRLILVGDAVELGTLGQRQPVAPGQQVVCLTLPQVLDWLNGPDGDKLAPGDEIVVVGRVPEPADRTALVLALHGNPVALRYCPDLFCADDALASVPLVPRPNPLDDFAKRLSDLLLGSLALALCAIPMLAIAAVIALDRSGPVLFRQQRLGLGGAAFTIYKFRTMVAAAAGQAEAPQAQGGDARITRFGAFLRRWGLDELPQLFNVLTGDMSLVGPRPHAFPHDMAWGSQLPHYVQRFRMRPGITGLAQVRGWRGYAGTLEAIRARLELDLDYIRRWSLLLDLRILLATLPALAQGALSEKRD